MEHDVNITSRLDRAWRRERAFFGFRGLFHLVLWATILLAMDFGLDFIFHLPGRTRMLLFAVNAAILLAVLYWVWWRLMKHYNALRVALQAERLYPQLGSILISYVQFSGQTGDAGASPSLIEAMRRQAIAQSAKLDFGKIVRFRSLRYVFAATVLVLGLAVVAGCLWPRHLNVFMVRMASPDADNGYPTRTIIASTSGSMEIQQGRTAVLRAVVCGVIPERAQLTITPDRGSAETVSVPVGNSAGPGLYEFIYRVDDVYRNFTYSFKAGDDSSKKCSVEVIAPPFVEPHVELVYPEYVKQPAKHFETLSFEALEGARIVWKMKSDRPLSGATLIPENGQAVSMTLSESGQVATVAMQLDKSFSYGFRWVDQHHKFAYEPEIRYTARVVPDRPPRVTLISPVRDETGTIRKAVDLVFNADDDYGVTSARIVYRVQSWGDQKTEGVEKTIPIRTFEKPAAEAKESFRWDTQATIPDLKAGDVIVYAVEVSDNRANVPGTARSAMRRMSVVSDEDYTKLVAERRGELLKKIQDVYRQEVKAADGVQGLQK